MHSFDKRILIIITALILLLGTVILAGGLSDIPVPQMLTENGEIGSTGPIRLEFSEPMEPSSVEARFKITPQVSGRLVWGTINNGRGYSLTFWPDQPFQTGQQVTVHLVAGAASLRGVQIRDDHNWVVVIRDADVLYLSPVRDPEIWKAGRSGESPSQITFTEGNVFDYQVSHDGNRIIYSAKSSDNGFDIWEVNRDGSQPVLLLPCQSDWCTNPTYSPDGNQIAYSRRRSGIMEGEGPGVPHIWMLYRNTLETEPLYVDPNVGGFDPVWSPDGSYLAFFDGLSQGVRVLNLESKEDYLLSSQMGISGSWSPDSSRLLFTDFSETDIGPSIGVFQVDVKSQEILRILGEGQDLMDYSLPKWNPNGNQIAVAMRFMNGGPGKQISIMNLAGTLVQKVTLDQLYTHTSYHWNPQGDALLLQRLKLNSSDQQPEVIVWNRSDEVFILVAQDAFLPRWLP